MTLIDLFDRPSVMPWTASKGPDRITGRTYLERGVPVIVLIRWRGKGPRNVLVERPDGSRSVRPFRGLRRMSAAEADG